MMNWKTEPVVDYQFLGQYRELDQPGEPCVALQMIGLFLKNSPDRLLNLRTAISQGKAHEIRSAAHAIKSSCGNVGAKRLGAISSLIEDLGADEQNEGALELFTKLQREFQKLEKELTGYMDRYVQ